MLTAGTRLRGLRQTRRTLVGEAGFHGSAVPRIGPAIAAGWRQSVDLNGNPLPNSVLQMHQLYIDLQLEAREYMEELNYRNQQCQRSLQDQSYTYKRSLEAAEKATQSSAASLAQARKQLRALQDQAKADKEELAAAQAQLAQLNSSSSSPGLGSGGKGVQAQQGPLTAQRCAGGSFPVGFGSVEQRECLDQLSVATEQLTAVLGQSDNLQYPAVQDMLEAAKESLEGTTALVSSWDRDSCAAALHHHLLNRALDIAQQQVDWHADSFVACLTSCPEAGRTELHAVLQQLQQAKSSTLFLVAQQQAPSHPATWKASKYVKDIRQCMKRQLEQQLGLGSDKQACQVWRPQLVAVAAAMTRVNLLLASLQSSCPGLQLVSRLEEWGAQEGQQACEAPVHQLLGKVEASRLLFLVRPGLVCAAAGGGRQVLVRQQAVALVPDPEWLEQQLVEAARKQQEDRERLEAQEEEHRRKVEEQQRMLKERSEERAKKLLHMKAEPKAHKVADVPGPVPDSSCSKGRGALAPMGCEPDMEKAEQCRLHLATHADCSEDPGRHQAPHRQRDDASCAATPPSAQDLNHGGGHAGCLGPDTQDSSSQGGAGQCSDADGQAGCGQGHENAIVLHHQTSAPDQGQLVAAATSLVPGQVRGGQGDANDPDQQLAAVGAAVGPSQEMSRLHGGADSTSRSAAQQHGARQHEGLETAVTQPPPCSLTECGAMQQPPHLPPPPPPPTPPPPPPTTQQQQQQQQQQSSPAFFPSHALQPSGSYEGNGAGHQAPGSSARQGLQSDRGAEVQAAEAASSGSASGEAAGMTKMDGEEQQEAEGCSMRTPPPSPMETDALGALALALGHSSHTAPMETDALGEGMME